MANEPVGKVNLRDLSPRDKGMASVEARRGAKASLKARTPLSLADLVGSVPPRGDIAEGQGLYKKFAAEPLHGFLVERNEQDKPEGEEEFVIVGPRVTAEGVNALLYFAAPYKGFGFDTDDIINDWTALYSGTTENERLRTAHSTMPGWSIFEQSRSLILDVLKRDHPTPYSYFLNSHPDDVIIPTIHGKKDVNGNITLSIEPLDDELRGLITEALPQHVTDPSRLDVGMGSVFVAAYSQDNARYPQEKGYTASSTRTQVIGPTQVLAFAIRRLAERQAQSSLVPDSQDIQQSKILSNYVDYLSTNDRSAQSGIDGRRVYLDLAARRKAEEEVWRFQREANQAEDLAARNNLYAKDVAYDRARRQAREDQELDWFIQERNHRHLIPDWARELGEVRVKEQRSAEDEELRIRRERRDQRIARARQDRDTLQFMNYLGVKPSGDAELDSINIIAAQLRRGREDLAGGLETALSKRVPHLKEALNEHVAHRRDKLEKAAAIRKASKLLL